MNQLLHKRTVADIPIFEFGEVTSTHDIAREMIAETIKSLDLDSTFSDFGRIRAIISATHQTKGRGRRERKWESTSDSSMLCTFILNKREENPFVDIAHLLAVFSQILSSYDNEVKIKWPNDLVVANETMKKIGGCLSEISGEFLLVGIGINIEPNAYGSGLSETAISLKEIGAEMNRTDLVDSVIVKYVEDLNGEISDEEIWSKYQLQSATISEFVKIQRVIGDIEGTAVGVNVDGSLLLQKSNGEIVSIFEGDVVHVRK